METWKSWCVLQNEYVNIGCDTQIVIDWTLPQASTMQDSDRRRPRNRNRSNRNSPQSSSNRSSPQASSNSPQPNGNSTQRNPSQVNTSTREANSIAPEIVDRNADGAEDNNDSDTEEWAKLRCSSVQTEVISERNRRNRQRSAGYPGLAFGSSIFSSGTLMKFSIIANELHNIMNVQLKRVNNLIMWLIKS